MRTAILALVISTAGAHAAVQATWGLDLLTQLAADRRNVAIPVIKAQLEGFVEDLTTEYRMPSVMLAKGGRGKITATVPRSGTWYPAFIFYDSAGDERIAISIDGVARGVAAANADDNRQRLFFLTEPVTFRGGEKIVLETQTSDGIYRTEDLLLLREKPAAKKHAYEFRDLHVQPAATGATVTWITTWPAKCVLEGPDRLRAAEDAAENNHRLTLTNLKPGRAYRFRISAVSREGAAVTTEWRTFRTQAPPAVAGSVKKDLLKLRMEPAVPQEFPATAGIPFPNGALASDRQIRLLDPSGNQLPLATETLARWHDGSVKWALLDFQGTNAAAIEYGAEVTRQPHSSALRLQDSADGVTVNTGPLRFTVSKRRFGLLESVWVNGERATPPDRPSAFYLTGLDGTVYTSLAAPDEVVVERNDPMRVVVRASGGHRAADGARLFAYTVRFHAFAGKPYVRVQHTFGNDAAASEFTSIKSLVLRLPLAGGRSQEARHWKQHTDDAPRIADWVEWDGGSRKVTLALRGMWQNYPKDVSVTADGIELGLCPPLRPGEYASAKGTVDDHRLYYYLQDGVYKFRHGLTKTHDIWIDFASNPSPLRTRTAPATALASPGWYSKTQVFGEVALPKATGIVKLYDEGFERAFEGYLKNRDVNREYGMLNFGDWWGEREINWGNSEYDTQHTFFLQAARTGDFRYFRAGEEVEWHNRDVDVVHYHQDKSRIGGVYLHSVGHTGDYYKESPVPGKGIPGGRMTISHTFIEGHLDYYLLTGDRRSLDTAKATADRYNTLETRNYDFTNCRNPGWHLILTMAMYNATNDRFYLNAAKIVVERVLERQTADGGWQRQMVPGHCECPPPRHRGNAGFMVGVLMTGLKKYYAATGDERVADSIVKASRFLVNDLWTPEVSGFRYTSCPRTRPGTGSNFLLFEGMVFAYERTQDAALRQVLLAGTDAAVKSMAAFGKGFTQYTRVTPHFIEKLARLRGD